MLQRIQTIWLLLAGISALFTLKLPYYSGIQDAAIPYHELNGITGGIPILIVTITVAVIAFVNIGLYKNRKTQLRLSVAGMFAQASLLFLYYQKVSTFTQGTLSLTCIFQMCVLLFFVLAARGIAKDEKLIKESDRLR